MPYVTCPTCGERGKIPPNLVGARIKCRKCGLSFMVAAPAAKAAGTGAGDVAGKRRRSLRRLPSRFRESRWKGSMPSSWVVPAETASDLEG